MSSNCTLTIKHPPVDANVLDYPFQHVVMDNFALNNVSYGVFCDRFSNWPGVYIGNSSMDVCKVVARLLEDYRIPELLTTDGGKNYTSARVEAFLQQYGIKHQISSVGNPHTNCRAELVVKYMKRLIQEKVNLDGSLDNAKFSRAILQYPNTRE